MKKVSIIFEEYDERVDNVINKNFENTKLIENNFDCKDVVTFIINNLPSIAPLCTALNEIIKLYKNNDKNININININAKNIIINNSNKDDDVQDLMKLFKEKQ